MFKKSPGRNQRSKGIKVKHVVQICLLLGVCFWLIYQVKHSHDKKKEFDEKDARISIKEENSNHFNLGRKGLKPHLEEVKNGKHEEEDDEETSEEENKHEEEHEVEDTKHEEEEQQDEENKIEESEEGRGGGDDEIDEQEQEKRDGEIDREEDFIDEEKDREEEDVDKETDAKENDERDVQSENEMSDDHDGDRKAHEAREEHYKADDASSEVSHNTETLTTGTEKLGLENSNENGEATISKQENELNNTALSVSRNESEARIREGIVAGDATSNGTAREIEETNSINSGDGFLLNSTKAALSNDQADVSNMSEKVNAEIGRNSTGLGTTNTTQQNETETLSGVTPVHNVTVEGTRAEEGSNLQNLEEDMSNTTKSSSESNQSELNSTISVINEIADRYTGDSANFSSETSASGKNTSYTNSGSSTITVSTNSTWNEKSKNIDESNGTNESLDSSTDGSIDTTDTSISQDEKDVRTDLETLPEMKTEGDNSEDATAE